MEDENTNIIEYLKGRVFKYLVLFSLYFLSGYFFGTSGVIILTIVCMFLNTSSNPRNGNQLSAYGILNPGFRRILGDLRLEQLERQLFNRYVVSDEEEMENSIEDSKEKYSDDEMNYPISKFSNKKCPRCNSGKKYKKCCALLLKS
ncbi:Uncharacterized protein cpbgf_400120 [Cryptosporidium parvum]|uniref:SAYSvFN domain-containing protein n=1 Tax=Cryptosporidium parvum TaxID=5807 RepID=A0A7S7LGV0_CRYPV|nr:Uncharacterized protein CPATCC_0017230 [Cryptosporidium parvum]WRK32128.1 Uncharacterized protein cpbgf_400120 [Cryptosporidium parvum]|eukprot:QOY41900.1 hypothetical protein CPATCC_001486 [Cryptosporidium parvum]